MEPVQAVQGTWTIAAGVLTGVLGSGVTWAWCQAGAETDRNYVVTANAVLVSGNRASVIVGLTYDINYNASFIECILDVQNGILEIDLVDAAARVPAAQRSFPLSPGTSYLVSAELGVADDGTAYVIFSVNGVQQLEIDDLSILYVAGMNGFGVWGSSPSNSATFTGVTWQSLAMVLSTPSDVPGKISQLLQAQWSLASPAVSDILWTDNKPDTMQLAGSNKNYGVAVYSPSSPVSTRPLCRELWEITETVQVDIYVKVASTIDAADQVRESIREECYRILHVNQAEVSGQQVISVVREQQKVEGPEMVRLCLVVAAVSWDLRT